MPQRRPNGPRPGTSRSASASGAGLHRLRPPRIKEALEQQLADRGLADKVAIIETGCLGPCSAGPALMIDDVFYEKLKPEDAAEIVAEHLAKGRVVERLTHKRPDGRTVANAADMDFFKRQTKIVLRNCGLIDPQRIEDYIARDGYQALAKVLGRRRPRGRDRDHARPRACGAAAGPVFPPGGSGADPRQPAGEREIRRLQRRRRRSRRVHGPQRAGRRSRTA